jgi:hypothetical protein
MKIILIVLIVIVLIVIFITLYKNYYLKEMYNDDKFNSTNNIPKNVWIFWNEPINNKTNFSVRLCYDIVKKECKGYNINMLTLENYKKYVTDNKIINLIDNKKLSYAHISDILRLYVIYKYGGIYLDASIILLDSLEWVYNYNNMGYNLIMYKNTVHSNPSEYKTPVLENWFIAASPNNEFLKLTLEKLVEIFEKKDLDIELKYLLSNKDVNYQNFSKHGTYHMAYFVFIYILYKHYKNGIKNALFLECSSDPNKLICSYLSYLGKKNDEQLRLFNKPITDFEYNKIKNEKMVKLIKDNRPDIDKVSIVSGSFMDKRLKKLGIKY